MRIILKLLILFIGLALVAAAPAQADIKISAGKTSNMTCAAGVCSPTANKAVLNVSDLESMLASGNVTVTTTGSGTVQAGKIDITAALTWSTSSILTLDTDPPNANGLTTAINISAPVSVTGTGGLTINNPAAGWNLAFTGNGNITFAKLTSSFVMNANSWVLVDNVAGLATAVADGDCCIALAQSYDASNDGTYSGPPAGTVSYFEGLGNSISNLTINDPQQEDPNDGLFKDVAGSVANFGLSNISITNQPSEGGAVAGPVAAAASGTFFRCWATGTMNVENVAGGLVGLLGGGVLESWTNVSITVDGGSYAGGIAGQAKNGHPVIQRSFALGPVTANQDSALIGGLVGEYSGGNGDTVSESYSTGAVTLNTAINNSSQVGGMIGVTDGGGSVAVANQTYSTGEVSAPASSCGTNNNCVGGWVGADFNGSAYKHNYWDRTTSGITNRSQGVGNIPSDAGVKGLTSTQLSSGLPKGFSSKIWAENPNINGGLPYLIGNPPP
ncbi:MAG TPA: hypothetical protein VGI20_04450 [Rhizomicrobium sp.]|jgi:hypothetical protein